MSNHAPGDPMARQPSTDDLVRKLKIARTLNVVLGAVAAVLAIVLAATYLNPPVTQVPTPNAIASQSASASASQTASAYDPVRNNPDDPLALGSTDAKVVLVEWADLRCPYCAVFSKEVFPKLKAEYIDTGKVRFEFNDVSFFGDQSTSAAVALRAAAEQGKFGEYLVTLFAAAPDSGHPDLPDEKLIAFAKEAKVPDLDKFKKDLASDELKQAVETSTATAQAVGISSVPFFYAGGQSLSGAQSYETFKQFLDSLLAA
ncbi:MAG: DsbA family protein [Propionibacteriaceae bacterium]|jgi:protein-disulfide isomerase|nr:DsbA family protein [Propionibacteriaceae bacterium]